MNYNYHTHTPYSHHATGEPEEYVKKAISGGIKYMGFSDHVPFICADKSESGYRVHTCDAERYCNEIKALAEKYRHDIELTVGFEMEYYPDNFGEMVKSASNFGGRYLILGEHFLCDESLKAYNAINTDSVETLKTYVSRLTDAIKNGVFTYVAHPDMIKFTKDADIYRAEMRKVCIASREYGIPLEINFLGIRTGRNYPNELFWQIAGEEKSPVTYGFDAHDPDAAYDGDSLVKADGIVKKYGLNYIGKPDIISI